LAVGATLVTSAVYSFTVWLAPVNGTFPTAGRYDAPGYGRVGVRLATVHTDDRLIRWLRRHGATMPYQLLTESSDQASPLILLGLRADAEGGYNTTDPAMSAAQLADLVAAGKARYFYVGGPYDERGGNSASAAARLVCPEVPQYLWADGASFAGSWLVDCRGRARELRDPYRWARAFTARHPKARRRYIL
jgi:hypothetical protein